MRTDSIRAPLVAGLLLRLAFIHFFPYYWRDSFHYDRIAANWYDFGVYSYGTRPPLEPTTLRPPVYEGYLAAWYGLFRTLGWISPPEAATPEASGNEPVPDTGASPWQVAPPGRKDAEIYLTAARWGQMVVDLGTSLLVSATIGVLTEGAGVSLPALWALCLCPFIAIYCAAIMSETITLFFWALTVYACALYWRGGRRAHLLLGAAAAAAAGLARADSLGLIVLPFSLAFWKDRSRLGKALSRSLLPLSVSLLLLAPWTARNLRLTGSFLGGQALIPVPYMPKGYMRWVLTWLSRPAQLQPVMQDPVWIGPQAFHPDAYPPEAFEGSEDRLQVFAWIDQVRARGAWSKARDVDQAFLSLAQRRAERHPFRFWIGVPLRRVLGIWTTSRTENFPLPGWREAKTPGFAVLKVGALGMNLAYLGLGLLGLFACLTGVIPRGIFLFPLAYRAALCFPVVPFPVLEPRYTLEGFIFLAGLAGLPVAHFAALARSRWCGQREGPRAPAGSIPA